MSSAPFQQSFMEDVKCIHVSWPLRPADSDGPGWDAADFHTIPCIRPTRLRASVLHFIYPTTVITVAHQLERLDSGQPECGRRGRQVIYRPRYRVNRPDIVKRRYRYIVILFAISGTYWGRCRRKTRYRWWQLTGIHRYDTDIGVISEPILTFSPISVKNVTISVVATYGYTPIFTDIGVISGPISAKFHRYRRKNADIGTCGF